MADLSLFENHTQLTTTNFLPNFNAK